MTAQASDKFIYQGESYSIAGNPPESLIKPADFGISTRAPHTANYRGFIATYSINQQSELVLQEMSLCPAQSDEKVAINGIPPEPMKLPFQKAATQWLYKDIYQKVNCTGSLLIGREFIRELYLHGGFHPAWKYEVVLKVDVSDGIVTAVEDVSSKMADFRQTHIESGNRLSILELYEAFDSFWENRNSSSP